MTLRVLVAVTHLLGAGHLTRAAAIARAFARAGHDATLVSGGLPSRLVRTDNIRFVQLPPVRTRGTDFRTLLDEDGELITPARLARRRASLVGVLEQARPDIVITELFPFGRRVLADEFMALIEAARAQAPRPLIAASIRDILAVPAKPGRVQETHDRLLSAYDAVLVHGDPSLVPLDASWPVDGTMRHLIHDTGYVDEHPADDPSTPSDPTGRDAIVVSGGSSAASFALYRAARGAAALMPDRPWRLLIGFGVPDEDFATLAKTASPNVAVERARSDFRAVLSRSALSVSQAGYNTMVDVLRTGIRSVLVPFEAGHETEQRLRAERLGKRGLAHLVPEAELTPERLADAVGTALRRPPPPDPGIALDGAERTVAIMEALWHSRRLPSRPDAIGTRQVGQFRNWSPLEDALRRAADQGRVLPFWWRDDDVVAPTRALDRLLALSRGFDIPIALAAIPARIVFALPARLAGEPLASILVHGLSHTNHAEPGDKKAEFGRNRPSGDLANEAAEALRLAQAAFGVRLTPIFVPPWNRIAPALMQALGPLGYRGLSAFGDPRASAGRLCEVSTHLDPIDWRGHRGLGDPDSILRALTRLVETRLAGDGEAKPIGLLTHHLVHDDAIWAFCEGLLKQLSDSAVVRWPAVHELFDIRTGASVIEP